MKLLIRLAVVVHEEEDSIHIRLVFAYSCFPRIVLRTCVVAFVDHRGVKHSAEVTAENVFEAAANGLKAISESWAEEPGLLTPIEVKVTAPVMRHELTLQALQTMGGWKRRQPKRDACEATRKDHVVSVNGTRLLNLWRSWVIDRLGEGAQEGGAALVTRTPRKVVSGPTMNVLGIYAC